MVTEGSTRVHRAGIGFDALGRTAVVPARCFRIPAGALMFRVCIFRFVFYQVDTELVCKFGFECSPFFER